MVRRKKRKVVNPLRPRYWGSWLLVGALCVFGLMPLRLSRLFGMFFGLALMAVNPKRRRIARINLRLAFPDLSDGDCRRLMRQHFVVVGQGYLDVGFLAVASTRRFDRKMRVSGIEHVARATDAGRGVILIAPHCVGMNVGGLVYARAYKGVSMYKTQRNPAANWLLAKIRLRSRSELVSRDAGLRPVIRAMKQGAGFYYLPDEDLGPEQAVFAPFFGVPRATVPVLGRLAQMTHADVIPIFTRLLPGGGGYEVIFKPRLSDFPTGDDARDAAAMNAAFEAGIREMPEQYMWTLKLFRSQPAGRTSPYP